MSIELTEKRKDELNAIVEKMNKDAEMLIYYGEESEEYNLHLRLLQNNKEAVEKLEEHERTYVEQGLIDRKDIHDVYWPGLGTHSTHERQKAARLSQEGKMSSGGSAEYLREG
jgi:hypothetical protein